MRDSASVIVGGKRLVSRIRDGLAAAASFLLAAMLWFLLSLITATAPSLLETIPEPGHADDRLEILAATVQDVSDFTDVTPYTEHTEEDASERRPVEGVPPPLPIPLAAFEQMVLPTFTLNYAPEATTCRSVLFGVVAAICSVPDHHIDPRRSAFFMARSVVRDIRNGVLPC